MDQAFLDESKGTAVLLGTIVPTVIATIFVLGRLYSRLIILGNWGADDSWILGSWILAVALAGVNSSLVNYGSGRHLAWVLQYADILATRLKVSFASRILYQTVLGTSKIATCELYLRIFPDKRSRIIVRSLEAFIGIFTFALLCSVIFRCDYIPDGWLPGGSLRTCHTVIPGLYVSAVCNILSDILLIIFAVIRVLPLKMARRQKIALLSIICLSILVVITAIINLVRVIQTYSSTDVTWDSIDITTWSAIEVATGLICTSAPAMKPLIGKLVPHLLSSIHGSYGNNSSYKNTRTAYGSNSVMSRSRRAAANQPIELTSNIENRTTNRVWRGDDESLKVSDGDSEKAVLGPQLSTSFGKGEIMKTVTLKIEEHGKAGSTKSDNGSMKGFEHI